MQKQSLSLAGLSLLVLLAVCLPAAQADIPPFGGGHRHRPQPPAAEPPKDAPAADAGKDKQDPPPATKDKKDAPAAKRDAKNKSKTKAK